MGVGLGEAAVLAVIVGLPVVVALVAIAVVAVVILRGRRARDRDDPPPTGHSAPARPSPLGAGRLERTAIALDASSVEESGARMQVRGDEGTQTLEAFAAGKLRDAGWRVFRTGNGFWKRLAMVVAVDELKNVQGIDSIGATMFLLQSPTLLSTSIPADRYRRFLEGLSRVGSFREVVEEHWDEFVFCNPGYRHGVLDDQGERERLLAVTAELDAHLDPSRLGAILQRIYGSGERTLRGFPELLLVRNGALVFGTVGWQRRGLGEHQRAVLDWLVDEIGVRGMVVEVRGGD